MKGHDRTRRSGTARATLLAGLAAFAVPATALASGAAAPAAGYADPASGWNHLWEHVLIDLLVIGVIFGLAAVYMLFKYRAKSPTDVGQGVKLSKAQSLAWALIPAAVFMADDFFLSAKGWVLWTVQRTPPANALEVKLTAQQFFWEFEYANGYVSTNDLKVPVGQPVVLRMTSTDVIHDLFIPEYRIKEDAMPGRVTYMWFIARKPGTVVGTCTEYCGVGHSQMPANIEAVPPAEFEAWLKSKGKNPQVSALPDQSN